VEFLEGVLCDCFVDAVDFVYDFIGYFGFRLTVIHFIVLREEVLAFASLQFQLHTVLALRAEGE
jgi:hypothetical protein